MKKIIVISAVNLVEGGTFNILLQCLNYLESFLASNNLYYRVIALVNKKSLFVENNSLIEYIEIPKAKKSWINRLKFEYFDSFKLSKELNPFLWLSLHDITPHVKSEILVTYCHNSTPFHKTSFRELQFSYKVFLFTLFYKYIYRINIKRNAFIIVQQDWLREAFSSTFNIDKKKIIVSYPSTPLVEVGSNSISRDNKDMIFFYPSLARPFKNFEIICEAVRLLNFKGVKGFKVYLTLDGSENAYAKWVVEKYNQFDNVKFLGLLTFEGVKNIYKETDCLIFPSKLETWGLPISEFSVYNRPMILSDIPYAHETAANSSLVSFFNPEDALELANRMEAVINGDFSLFAVCKAKVIEYPVFYSWESLFTKLLVQKQ